MNFLIFSCSELSHDTAPEILKTLEIVFSLLKLVCFEMHSAHVCHHSSFWLCMQNPTFVICKNL